MERARERVDVLVFAGLFLSDSRATTSSSQRSKITMFSQGDIEEFQREAYEKFTPETTHAVLGDMWPHARRELVCQGLEPPPFDVVKTVIRQSDLIPPNLETETVRLPYISQ